MLLLRIKSVVGSVLLNSSILRLVGIVLTLIYILFLALEQTVYVPTFHLDGAFQTASGLFRLDQGQLPGKDFFPYLGIGPILVLFPFFKLLGGNLVASSFAAKFVTLVLAWVIISTHCLLVFKQQNKLNALFCGAVFFVLLYFLYGRGMFPGFLFEPGNSLKPIRSSLPYLDALLIYALLRRDALQQHISTPVLLGWILGLSLLWSNDFAITTTAIFSVFICLFFNFFAEIKQRRQKIFLFIFSLLLTWFAISVLITQGHITELLKYNFADVATDQWWYYGPYTTNDRIYTLSEIYKLVSVENYFPIVILGLGVFSLFITRNIEDTLWVLVGLSLFAGGTVASIGGHLGGYFEAFRLWGILTSLFIFFKLSLSLFGTTVFFFSQNGKCLTTILLVCFLIANVTFEYKAYSSLKNGVASNNNYFFVSDLGGFLHNDWKAYLNFIRQNRDKTVLEEYWGLWSSFSKSQSPWAVDSVIHALGKQRAIAQSSLSKSDYIITTKYQTSPDWQPWSLSQNYWFYQLLIHSWAPVFTSPTTVVWKQLQNKRNFTPVNCVINPTKNSFKLNAIKEGFYEVDLSYKIEGKGRHLAMIRNNISYPAGADGYLSLPPSSGSVTIPVLVTDEYGNNFDSKLLGNNNIKIELLSCAGHYLDIKANNVLHKRSETDFYLTDQNWQNGISLFAPGFFVPNLPQYVELYKTGNYVDLGNNDIRKILAVERNGIYLNVFVDGTLINPSKVDYPNKFKVIKKF